MPWVDFAKAAQAVPGARMRQKKPFRMGRHRGRPREYRVIGRGMTANYGNAIHFDDGAVLNIAHAKNTMEIYEKEASGD